MTESLWVIEESLADLIEARAEVLDRLTELEAGAPQLGSAELIEGNRSDLAQIDAALLEYAKREIRKVDNIRGMWKHLQMMQVAASAEAEVQHQRAKSYERALTVLKSAVQVTMEEMEWREGKPRKLEGKTGSISLKGNGGKEPVVITDESLIPDQFCTVTVKMPFEMWKSAAVLMSEEFIGSSVGPRVPSLTLIGEALNRPCGDCQGKGLLGFGLPGMGACTSCGGSGRQGVPGAVLGQRGAHVECK